MGRIGGCGFKTAQGVGSTPMTVGVVWFGKKAAVGMKQGSRWQLCPPSMMQLGGSDLRRSFARMGARFG
jgi:hypothetical protein